MSPTVHSVKLQLVCGIKMSKTATSNFLHVYTCIIACMDGGYSISRGGGGGGGAGGGGGGPPPPPPPPPPPIETLHPL